MTKNSVYNIIRQGLEEAVAYAQGKEKSQTTTITQNESKAEAIAAIREVEAVHNEGPSDAEDVMTNTYSKASSK